MKVRSVTLHVAGQTLSIRTDAPEDELETLTELVNGRVREIQAAAPSAPAGKVYLLTALAIADELRQLRAELEHVRNTVSDHAQGALRLIDQDARTG